MQIMLMYASNDIQLDFKQNIPTKCLILIVLNFDTNNHDNHNLISSYCHSNKNNTVNLIKSRGFNCLH